MKPLKKSKSATAKVVPKKEEPKKALHIFRNDRVEQKKKEGWKVVEERAHDTLMEK